MSHPNKPTRAQTLRVVANLIEIAENNGSTIEPGIGVYGAGRASISINGALTGGTISHREITAWQLATGTAWDLTTYYYTYQGSSQKTRGCDFDWQGVRIHLDLIEQTAEVAA